MCGVVGLVDIGLKRVLGKVVVAGADVGIAEFFTNPIERAVVVARGVFVIVDDRDTVFLAEVEEVLLLVAHDYGDIRNACFEELFDLALDEDLSANFEQALGLLI